MASATCPSSGTTDYLYDGNGQRVAKMVNGAITEQDVYNTSGQAVVRYDGAGNWTDAEVWAGGAHLAIYANGQTYFPMTDQVGTERARFAATGGIVETCMSEPFGDNLQCSGTDSSPYKFGKLQRDAESGDDHAMHRDYNSTPYRWLTPDPAGTKVVNLTDPQTWNLYMYSHDNPVTDDDPSGLQTCKNAAGRSGNQPSCTDSKRGKAQKQTNGTPNGNIIYNETSGLRPTTKSGNGSGTNMHAARVDIGHVLLNREAHHQTRGVASSQVPARDRNNPEYRDSQGAAAQAARSPDSTHGATHFYLNYPGERTPSWARGRTPAATFGPFLNAAGGGDVPKGADVWIVIIQ